jgi:hypothetical protein
LTGGPSGHGEDGGTPVRSVFSPPAIAGSRGRQGRLVVRPEAHCLYPALVWRPCLESLSPFFPFHMLTVGDHRIYVRVDGRLFTTLHINLPGI